MSVRDSRGRTVSHRDDGKQNGNSKRSRDVVPQTRGLGGTTQARDVVPHIRLSLGTTIVPGTTQAWRDDSSESRDDEGWTDWYIV